MRYETDFLSLVVFELKFDPILTLFQEEPTGYQAQVTDIFPRCRIQKNIEIRGTLSPPEDTKTEIVNEFREWVFHTEGEMKSLVVGPTLFRMQSKQYEGFEVFLREFHALWDTFTRAYDVRALSRTGLRYVNQIRLDTGLALDWSGLISDRLTRAVVDVEEDNASAISRSMHELHTTFDSHRLTFRFGIHNADFPNPVAAREFVLDYDCFSIGTEQPSDAEGLLDRYHLCIEEAFESSIEDGLRDLMGRVENAPD